MSIDRGLNSEVEVRIRNSLKVSGRFTLIHQDGSKEIVNGKRAFCRCGLSSSMPFCDSSHRSKSRWIRKIREDEVDEQEYDT